MITIIDYKSGNLRSISNGFKKIGCEVEITSNIEKIANAEYLVLPGVGAFGTAMKNLESYRKIIIEHINDDKPFLGICLGQQVLTTASEESKDIKGLDLFKGQVKKIPKGRKIPHMGWNKIKVLNNSSIFKGIDNKYFYFVHSYHLIPEEQELIAAKTDYGIDLVAAISRNNLFSTQFHPEKSGKLGLKILKNFTNI